MTQSTKDQVAGAMKEKAGEILNSPGLTADGQDEHTAGTIQKKVGEIEKVFEN